MNEADSELRKAESQLKTQLKQLEIDHRSKVHEIEMRYLGQYKLLIRLPRLVIYGILLAFFGPMLWNFYANNPVWALFTIGFVVFASVMSFAMGLYLLRPDPQRARPPQSAAEAFQNFLLVAGPLTIFMGIDTVIFSRVDQVIKNSFQTRNTSKQEELDDAKVKYKALEDRIKRENETKKQRLRARKAKAKAKLQTRPIPGSNLQVGNNCTIS